MIWKIQQKQEIPICYRSLCWVYILFGLQTKYDRCTWPPPDIPRWISIFSRYSSLNANKLNFSWPGSILSLWYMHLKCCWKFTQRIIASIFQAPFTCTDYEYAFPTYSSWETRRQTIMRWSCSHFLNKITFLITPSSTNPSYCHFCVTWIQKLHYELMMQFVVTAHLSRKGFWICWYLRYSFDCALN